MGDCSTVATSPFSLRSRTVGSFRDGRARAGAVGQIVDQRGALGAAHGDLIVDAEQRGDGVDDLARIGEVEIDELLGTKAGAAAVACGGEIARKGVARQQGRAAQPGGLPTPLRS